VVFVYNHFNIQKNCMKPLLFNLLWFRCLFWHSYSNIEAFLCCVNFMPISLWFNSQYRSQSFSNATALLFNLIFHITLTCWHEKLVLTSCTIFHISNKNKQRFRHKFPFAFAARTLNISHSTSQHVHFFLLSIAENNKPAKSFKNDDIELNENKFCEEQKFQQKK
jgi:hypothetical protein